MTSLRSFRQILAFIALAVTCVQSNSSKIWRFQIGDYGGNLQYIDEVSGQVRGYEVDVVNKVCQIANKNCVLIWDVWANCWDSYTGQLPRAGPGLLGGWYDACVGWFPTYDKKRTFEFSKEISKNEVLTMYIKAGRSIPSYPDLTGVKIGFYSGLFSDEFCLAQYVHITGFDPSDTTTIVHLPEEDSIINALINEEVDVVFMARLRYIEEMPEIDLYKSEDFIVNKCNLGGTSVMVRKNSADLLAWWNPAWEKLLSTREYDQICREVSLSHGHTPGAYTGQELCVRDFTTLD